LRRINGLYGTDFQYETDSTNLLKRKGVIVLDGVLAVSQSIILSKALRNEEGRRWGKGEKHYLLL
jgi:hypothetical protein